MTEQVVTITAMRQALAGYAALFEPGALTPSACQTVVREAATIEKIAATIVAIAAARVADSDLWRRDGDRSPAHALARQTGRPVGRAKDQLDTAKRLRDQPDLDAAARNGAVSPDEAAAISDAAAADPAKERELLDKAKRSSLKELRDECQKVKANADPDPEATRRRIHRERRVRTWTDKEGAWNLHARGRPEDGAEFMAALQPLWDAIFTRARSGGTVEPSEAYGFDALVELARHAHANRSAPPGPDAGPSAPPCEPPPGDAPSAPPSEPSAPTPGPPPGDAPSPPTERPAAGVPTVQAPTTAARAAAKVVVRIDLTALVRGHPIEGETCDIVGIGPVSVAAVRELIESHSFIAAVLTKGRQVMGVAHLGRGANAQQATALLWAMPTCSVDGCPASAHLENDHRLEFSRIPETELSNLDPLCRFHHHLKTHEGWALADGDGKRPMVPPDHPSHPRSPKLARAG